MKLFLIFPLLVTMVSSDSDCIDPNSRDTHRCSGIVLKPNEPLNVNDTRQTLVFDQVSGSIGVQTFSHLLQVTQLTFFHSKIKSVEDGALCALPKLQTIFLISNEEFPALTNSLFTNCDKVTDFMLENGTLETTTFENMPNLRIVRLEKIHLPHFTREYLQPLKNLITLSLRACTIEQLGSSSLCSSPKLTMLDMDENDIQSMLSESVFENCNNVEHFYYTRSRVKTKVQEGVFSGFANLKVGGFGDLDIDNLSKGQLRGLNTTRFLDLHNSNIKTIDKDAFEGFGELTTLRLSGNYIDHLDSDVFAPLTSLTKLNLDANKITSIDDFKHSTLEELKLDGNRISTVNAEAVKMNLPNLKSLSLSRNTLSDEDQLSTKLHDKGILVINP